MGAVVGTLSLRLFPQHLEFIVNDAEDKVLFVDQSLIPLLKPLMGKIPSVERIVVMADAPAGSPSDDGTGRAQGALERFATLDYETLLKPESESYAWPKLSERMAAALCYTSGTTGNPKADSYTSLSPT